MSKFTSGLRRKPRKSPEGVADSWQEVILRKMSGEVLLMSLIPLIFGFLLLCGCSRPMEPTKSTQSSPSVTKAPLSAISVDEALQCARKAVVHDHANDPEEVEKRVRPRPTVTISEIPVGGEAWTWIIYSKGGKLYVNSYEVAYSSKRDRDSDLEKDHAQIHTTRLLHRPEGWFLDCRSQPNIEVFERTKYYASFEAFLPIVGKVE